MTLGWAKNDTFYLGRAAKMEIPSLYKFNTKHACVNLVSNPDPSLSHSAGCIASPARGRKGLGLATLARFSCSLEEFA